jgi:hypothetical protein
VEERRPWTLLYIGDGILWAYIACFLRSVSLAVSCKIPGYTNSSLDGRMVERWAHGIEYGLHNSKRKIILECCGCDVVVSDRN